MKSIILDSHAKINLRLEVLRKRDDGYHDVRTILHTISLSDEVHIIRSRRNIEVICNNHNVPSNEANIAYAAAHALLTRYHIKEGVCIVIKKKIPVAAGLGGGSSNAATTLIGINQLFNLGISSHELMVLGSTIGADVPFFIFGDTALATGIGDQLEKITIHPILWLLLVSPPLPISTDWAYKNIKMELTRNPLHINIPNHLTQLSEVTSLLYNDLEKVVIPHYPVIQTIKDELLRRGAEGSLMSGSGSTVYGIFLNKAEAERAYEQIKASSHSWDLVICQSHISSGSYRKPITCISGSQATETL